MKKLGYVTRNDQYSKNGGHTTYIDLLRRITSELGIELVIIETAKDGYEYEMHDLMNYPKIVKELEEANVDAIIYGSIGFRFLELWYKNCAYFTHYVPFDNVGDSLETGSMNTFFNELREVIVPTKSCLNFYEPYSVKRIYKIPMTLEFEKLHSAFDLHKRELDRVIWTGGFDDKERRRFDDVAEVVNSLKGFKFTLVTDCKEGKEYLEKRITLDEVDIKFNLPREQMYKEMNKASIMFNHSKHDQFSFPIAEALVLGLRCVIPKHYSYDHYDKFRGITRVESNDEAVAGINIQAMKNHRYGIIREDMFLVCQKFKYDKIKGKYERLFKEWNLLEG